MKKKFVLLSAISMSVLLSACCSNDHMERSDRDHTQRMTQYYFDQMDKNDNGLVSMKEYMNYEHMRFQEADTNQDGQLSMDELVAQKMREKSAMKDWNHNYSDDRYSDTRNSQQ